jgi:hypothetical protein
MASEESAAERKRKRLEAWRKRQQTSQEDVAPVPTPAPAIKVSLSLSAAVAKKMRNKMKKESSSKPVLTTKPPSNPFGAIDDDDDDADDDSGDEARGKRGKLTVGLGFTLLDEEPTSTARTVAAGNGAVVNIISEGTEPPKKRRKKGRWDAGPGTNTKTATSDKLAFDKPPSVSSTNDASVGDALDKFMEKLEAGALGAVTTQVSSGGAELLSIDVGGSMMRVPKLQKQPDPTLSGGVITSEQIAKLSGSSTTTRNVSKNKQANPDALYTASDWESDAQSGAGTASEAETDDEEEEKARRAFIEALKSAPGPPASHDENSVRSDEIKKPSLAAEVKDEKNRREQMLRDLEREAEEARTLAEKSAAPDLGRLYNDAEGGIMEEAERNLDAAMATPDALQVLAELNKKKELKSVDHSKIDYIPFKKNLYIVPRTLADLSRDDVADLRAKLKVKVRGHGAPAPVSSFEHCGLSERILKVLERQGIMKPFPVQAQCIPCIMAGRDTIGIAKTGSGKTLSYLLPLLRHIMAQPPLEPNESGPIGLILAPARELAYQIHLVCKSFTKSLGLK